VSSPGTQPTVAELTARAVAGDRAAYEALFRMRCAFVEAESARRLGRRRDLADDVAQDAWLRVARGPRRCADDASLDAWLRRLVRSSAIDLLRSELARRARERRVAADRPEAVAFLEDLELLEEIRRDAAGIGGISDDERAVLEVRARADATLAQLARWLGVGPAAVDSRLRRAAERARAHALAAAQEPARAATRQPMDERLAAHPRGTAHD
jgi:RNA polymerase sigma factor (sigma-70 family)